MNLKSVIASALRDHPEIRRRIWKLRSSIHGYRRDIILRNAPVDGNKIITDAIRAAKPFASGKMGSIEANALAFYLKNRNGAAMAKSSYDSHIRKTLFENAGVFPTSEDAFDDFCHVYYSSVADTDALVSWNVAGEVDVLRSLPRKILIRIKDLEPYYLSGMTDVVPWSAALEGLRVVVVSPFASSIEKQYARRTKLWDDVRILPDFDLRTVRAPLSAALVPPTSKDWTDALNLMKHQVDQHNYDVLLVGAGAYSLPLGAYAKSKGKIGLHLGGALQILFGITGKRWEENAEVARFIKPSWVRPSLEETPQKATLVEGGCYW